MIWSNHSGFLFKKRFKHKPQSQELFIILPPWGGRLCLNLFLRKAVLRKGCSILEYEFPRNILSSDWERTLNYFNFVRELVLRDAQELKNKYKFSKISIVGVSLGCINACMVANNNDVNILCLIVPGNCLAEVLWYGAATQGIRKDYEEKGITLENLKKYWHSLAPETNIENLRAEKILVYVSKADKVIPFYNGKTLIEKIKSHNHHIFYKIHKNLGHRVTALVFYLTPQKSLFN
jgi:hypothetical protein